MPRPSKGPRLGSAAGSPFYYLYWTEDGRPRRRSTGTTDLPDAQRQLAELTLRLSARVVTCGPLPPERFTVARALEIYLQDRGASLASAWLQATHAEKFLKFFGDGTVDLVTNATVNRYVASRRMTPGLKGRAAVSDATIRRELAVLQSALNFCVREGLLSRAPHIQLPRQPPGRQVWIDHDEAAVLMASMTEPHLRLFTLLGLHTGARKTALLELNWPQIDFTGGLIYLNPPGRTQTTKRRPPVPMTAEVQHALREAHSRAKCSRVIEYHGKPVKDVKKAFQAATLRAAQVFIERAESASPTDRGGLLASAEKLKNVTPHVLRHTAGSWMAQAGIPMGKIASLLGHTEQKTTALYAHMHPDYLREATDAISARAERGRRFVQLAGNSVQSASSSVIQRQQPPAKS